MNLKNIRRRAQGFRDGVVTPEEVEFARNVLNTGAGDVFAALYVVGLCGSQRDAAFIERFLHPENCGEYSGLALKALCRYLGLTKDYGPLVRHLVFSDQDIGWGGSRNDAISLADVYLDEFADDREFACRLVEILLDEAGADRHQAQGALADILGIGEEHDGEHSLLEVSATDIKNIVDAANERFGCCAASGADYKSFRSV